MRVTWYRFATTFARRWTGYLALVLLIGMIGGIGLASVAAARRTQSSYASFLASTNPSDLSITIQAPVLTKELERVPGVQRVEAALETLNAFPLTPKDTAILPVAFTSGEIQPIGSIDGLYFDQDRVTVAAGRMADPRRADQFVATATAARLLGWHVGEVIPMGFYTNSQGPSSKPNLRLRMTLVGTVVFNDEVVLDDVDRFPTYLLFTPALAKPFSVGPESVTYGLKLKEGAGGVTSVEAEIVQGLPKGTTYSFHVTSVVSGQVDRSVRPETIALGVFGGIALLAILLISAQVISRKIQERDEEVMVLRALGASRSIVVGDNLLGILAAVVVGSVLALGVAVALSPLSPIGPVRPVYPSPGVAFDALVLGFGALGLIVCIGAVAAALALRSASSAHEHQRLAPATRNSTLARLASGYGASLPAATGVRFALESGHGRTSVPARSALFGNVLAIAIIAAALTFGSGLSTLVSHPSLYGWNWNYALQGYPVAPQSIALLAHDHFVAAWSEVNFANAQIDQQTVPIILASTNAQVGPAILSGHALEADDQIVLGAATLAQLHKRVGETVLLSYGSPSDAPVYVPPTQLLIVGTTTLPAIGESQSLHTSMGTGAVVPIGLEPPAFQKFLQSPNPTLNGPNMVLIRLRAGASAKDAVTSLQRIAVVGTKAFQALPTALYQGQYVALLGVQYPAEIENYQSIGATPALLASGLAIGVAAALGLTLIASVRRRRRDLALLKALGFSRRQLASCVAWQSTVAVAVGVIVGEPLGIALGRWLWDLFADEIYAVPSATVPALPLVLVALGALVLANVVAALPGRYAARTPTAIVLRTE